MRMPSYRVGYSADPFMQMHIDAMREDLEGLFGGEDEEDILSKLGVVDPSSVDIDDVDISVFDKTYDSDYDSEGDCNTKVVGIRPAGHDCMWGGQCCNKEYQRTQVPPPRPPPPPPQPPSVVITHSSHKVVTIQKCVAAGKCSERTDVVVVTNPLRTPQPKSEGRSLLLNRTTVQPQPPKTPVVKRELPSRPETPQSLSGSDDDFGPITIDTHNTGIICSALDVLNTPSSPCDDLMFGDMLRTKDERVSSAATPSHTDILRISASATSDHNYDGSSKSIKLEGLGVDTPSDSEEDEEIDVVSLSERSSSSRSSSCGGLPTRPTPRDQEHLEEITTSLLSASEAVSRKLKKTINTQRRHKRKKYHSESSDCDEEYDHPMYTYQEPTSKRQKSSPAAQVRRKKSSRFGEEEDSQEKRDLHNNMERMRRIDLRNSFEELKALVPGLANKERAAKVVILREAANYCCELGAESQSKCMQVMALRKEQERLRSMVSSLRKAAAMACIKGGSTKRN